MKISMTLLSDALPGSGEGLAGIIDTEVNYDQYGLPFIPAKRLKGILRESAEELLANQQHELLDSLDINELFGKSGHDEGSAFRIKDGRVRDHNDYKSLMKELSSKKKSVISPQDLLDYFSYTRSNTTINSDGVAENNTLRTFRVLRKDLVFDFDIFLPEKHKPALNIICRYTKSFGISRTRGLGEIQLTLIDDDAGQKNQFKVDEEAGRLWILLENESDLLTSNYLGKNQVSRDIIPGTAILGALATRFIEKNKLGKAAHKDARFSSLFLKENMIFHDALPYDKEWNEDELPQVFSNSLVKVKDSQRILDLHNAEALRIIREDDLQTKGQAASYGRIDDDEVFPVNVDMQVHYHHSRPADKSVGRATKTEGEFFQFEAISAGQSFLSCIEGEPELLQEIAKLLEDENYLFIGKSRTAEYGWCRIKLVQKEFENAHTEWPNGDIRVFTLQSDAMLRDENGQFKVDKSLFREAIAASLNVNADSLEEVSAFIKPTWIGGYLGVWQLPKKQLIAFKAGSSIALVNKSGESLSISQWLKPIGERLNEGFGQLMLDNSSLNAEFTYAKNKENGNRSQGQYQWPLVKDFIFRIAQKRVKVLLDDEALRKSKSNGASNSLISRIEKMVKSSQSFQEWEDKLNNLKETARRSLDKDKIINFLYLEKQTGNYRIKTADWKDNIDRKIADSGIDIEIQEINTYLKEDERPFALYQYYVLAGLRNMKLANRIEKKERTNG